MDMPAPAHPFSKQELLDVAATVVKLYFAGVAKGPQAVEQELASILAGDVVIKADRVKRFHDTQVRVWLGVLGKGEGGMAAHSSQAAHTHQHFM